MITKYHRPHCKNCNLIWGREAIGRLMQCPHCGNSLQLKSFNPWFKTLGGVAILEASVVILFLEWVPLIWIGGFILGPVLIFNAIKNWSRIKKLDDGSTVKGRARSSKRSGGEVKDSWREFKETKGSNLQGKSVECITITCGKCFRKMSVPKGKGLIRVTCPHCSAKHTVRT